MTLLLLLSLTARADIAPAMPPPRVEGATDPLPPEESPPAWVAPAAAAGAGAIGLLGLGLFFTMRRR